MGLRCLLLLAVREREGGERGEGEGGERGRGREGKREGEGEGEGERGGEKREGGERGGERGREREREGENSLRRILLAVQAEVAKVLGRFSCASMKFCKQHCYTCQLPTVIDFFQFKYHPCTQNEAVWN